MADFFKIFRDMLVADKEADEATRARRRRRQIENIIMAQFSDPQYQKRQRSLKALKNSVSDLIETVPNLRNL